MPSLDTAALRRSAVVPPTRVDGLVGRAALLLAGALCAGALAGTLWLRRPVAPEPALVPFRVGALTIKVPQAWLGPSMPRVGGATDALELKVPLAALLDPAPSAGDPLGREILHVAILPVETGPSPAERAGTLYARFVAAAAVPVEGGLIRREFRPGTPFEGETFYVVPPDGRRFTARCAAPSEPAACLSELRLSEIDLRVRFAPVLLAEWERVVQGLAQSFGTR
ncbi:MAG TPA: hypothetical protein VIL65_17255 [Beijerinckiaceae bacterium]|jgi:hypothetical protein